MAATGAPWALHWVRTRPVTGPSTQLSPLSSTLEIRVHRGDVEEAQRQLSLYDRLTDSSDPQDLAALAAARAAIATAEERYAEALEAGAYAVEAAVLSEADAVRVQRRLDAFEQRLLALE